jgi:phage terminase large subunit GpA-like protein
MAEAVTEAMTVWGPPPRLTVSEWADRHRVLSPEASAEPGKWITARAEYQRGIMDAITSPEVETVVVMKSAQIGWTEIINNVVGYYVAQDPAPLLVVQPTLEMGQAWSRDRLAPMLRDTPQLRGLIADPKARDGDNTLLHKVFPGGHLTIAGANSAAGLASRPIRVVLFDEVDRYPASAGTEGDPITLGRKRTATFWNRKVLMGSTPTIAGSSRIEIAYEQSDRRRYWVPCPHCVALQVLRWDQVRWDGDDARTARYYCAECGAAWTDSERWAAQRRGEWRAEGEFAGTAGFHISELNSPWRKISETVGDFLAAKARPEMLVAWVNTALGETFTAVGDAPAADKIAARREPRPPRTIPGGGLFLTGAADVQGDRIEWDVWAWDDAMTGWLVDSGVIEGTPHAPATWAQMREVTLRTYADSWDRQWPVDAWGIDAGYVSQEVYRFVLHHPDCDRGRVFALDGRGDVRAAPIGAPRRVDVDHHGRKVGAVPIWPVGTHGLKLAHYGALRRTIEGPGDDGAWPVGALRLPEWVQPEYCAQLASEVLDRVTPRSGGAARLQWRRLPNLRNERLDTAVYARGLAHHLADRLTAADWTALRYRRAAPDAPPPPVPLPAAPAAARGRAIAGFGRRIV